MKKGFSLLNIIILVSAVVLSFILFKNYTTSISQKENNKILETGEKEIKSAKGPIKEEKNGKQKEAKTQAGEVSALPNPDTLPTASGNIETFIPNLEKEKKEKTNPGYFINEKYKYKITFPTDWNIKDTYLEEITIGTIPPKNGQGAMKVKIGTNTESEIKTLKQNANEYPGIINIKEEKTLIDSIEADKITLSNSANGTKTTYILFSTEKISYIITYTHESEEFINEVEQVLKDFKIIK